MFPYWEQVKNRGEVIAYYEGEMHYPPAHLIEPLAKALKISTDEHLGIKAVKQQRDPQHAERPWGQIFNVNIFSISWSCNALSFLSSVIRSRSRFRS